MEPGTVHVFDDHEAAHRAVAELIVAQYEAARADRGRFRLGLSGGRDVASLYDLVSGPSAVRRIEWSHVEILFADERAVPPDDPRSNYGLVRDHLLRPAGVPDGNVHRFTGESDDLEAAARAYEPVVAQPVDLLLLGVGPNGHTCSLMPHSPLLAEYVRRAAAVYDSPAPPPRRLTITPRVIGEARHVGVLVTGSEKSEAVARALEGETPVAEVPAVLLRSCEWFLDRESASRLRLGRSGRS